MKEFILKLILFIAKFVMQAIYFFIKIFTKQKNKVTLLSRQSNNINIDFILIKKEIENINRKESNNIKLQISCKKIPNNLLGKIKYCFYMLKCMYHIATSKVCIIDGYNIAISALKHKKNLEIVQIWHAMGAIKKFGYQVLDKKEGSDSKVAKIMEMHANYNCITCTSKETRKIYAEAFNTNIEKIKILGMPSIDYLLEKNCEIDNNIQDLYKEYPRLKERKNIVYVPTFRKENEIDVQPLIDLVDEKKYNLIIKLHPLDNTQIDNKYKIDSKYNTEELLKIADYVITDYSAVAFEAATLDKPLFFYLYDINEYTNTRGLNINLNKEMKNSTKTNISDILEIIENDTYDYTELKKFKEKYIETADTNNTKRLVNYILKKLAKK